jgi:YebC/PmpR family DNA-binding regulatory protein
MAGHSHWANIARKKGANDAKRGKLWSKLARRIIVAAKAGGGNPDENLSLRYAIDEARDANMPKDTITKAIKKGTGELESESYESIVYEGYGPGGTAFLVECLTDNRNRTGPEMRKLFERGGGQLGTTNCVAWMFQQKGRFIIAAEQADEEQLMELALDAGADDVEQDEDMWVVTCPPTAFGEVKGALADAEIAAESAQVVLVPDNLLAVDADTARKALRMMEEFDDHDDVQSVATNFDIPDEVLADVET